MSDGPSDEEGFRSYNDNEEEHINNGDVIEEDIQHIEDYNDVPPPPTSTPPIQYKQQRRTNSNKDKSSSNDSLPNYPMTIEVKTEVLPAPQRSARPYTDDNEEEEEDAAEYSEEDESRRSRRDSFSLSKQNTANQPTTKYESFPAHSISASHTDSPSIQSRSVASTKQQPSTKSSRGQVLVHYHPQLGDEGYESTLLDTVVQQNKSPAENKYSRVSKAINTATSRNSTSHYSNRTDNIRPPKHIYPTTNRGMHTRAIDDERHESYLKTSSNKNRNNKPSYSSDNGNDEYNNAATRQLRRRVFRVAMERHGIHDTRRKKLLDADADVGGPSLNTTKLSPSFPKSPGHQKQATRSIAEDAGDMPLTPGKSTTPKNNIQQPSPIFSPISKDNTPPSPPSQPPSYKTLVYNLIAANEPEKIIQIDRVMEKYVDREEELIKKLDLRYRRRRMKKNAMSDSKEGEGDKEDVDGVVGSKDKSSAATPSLPQQPVLIQDNEEEDLPMMEIKTETTSTPTKLTFIKLDGTPTKSPGVEEKGKIFTPPTLVKSEGGDEEEDELMMPPQLSKRTLPPSITDSTISPTKTNKVQSNNNIATATTGSSVMSATMASLGEDDDDVNSGMIPTIAPNNKQSIATNSSTTANVKNLGNQVVNERLLREREERGKVKETLIERLTSTQSNKKLSPPSSPSNKLETISSSSPPSTPGKQQLEQLDTIGDSSPTKQLQNPYHLKQCQSYGDGISVITMETKGTQLHQKPPAVGANGEAVYNFDEMMKRPPKNITLEGSFSGSNDAGEESDTKKTSPERLQRVIPEAVESPNEKAQAEKTSLEGAAKLDDVEARIRARQKLREDDAKNKALAMADENRTAAHAAEQGVIAEENESLPKVKSLDEDVSGMETMFREANIKDSANEEQVKDVKDVVADPYIIEGVLSSFDEDDQKPKPPQDERKTQTPTSPTINEEEPQHQGVLNTSLLTDSTTGTPSRYSSTAEEAIAAATRSELQRQKEVAEYKQQHERDTSAASALTSEDLEEEIARLVAEKESRIQAEKAVALMKAQRELEEERMARAEAEAARIKAEEELQRLRLGQATSISSKEAGPENEVAEEEPSLDQARFEQEQQRIKLEQMAVEAESARVKAEEDLEQLRLSRSTKDAVEVARSTEEDDVKNEVARDLDQERLEAEATRLKAEKDLEKLEAEREMASSKEASQEDDKLSEQQPLSYAAITKDDEVEKFRLGYSSDENDDIQLKPTTEESVFSIPDDETAGGKLPPSKQNESSSPDHKLIVSTPDDEIQGGLQDKPVEVKRSSPELEEPPTISRSNEKVEVPSTPVEKEADEAQIHHVARVTFEGDTSKGQLSFITGAKVEAHSNQRGPWWLGRCGGRTGWFPASAVVPADEFLSPSSTIQTDQDESEEMKKLSGDELNAVYDLIRNPSDDEEEDDDSEEGSSSPAKSRWLDDGAPKSPPTRVDSPPIDRMDPSEMAGLSQRLYDSQDEGSRSNQNDARSPTPVASVGSLSISTEPAQSGEADETLSKDEPSKPAQEASSSNAVDQTQSVDESSKANKPQSTAVTTTKQPEWRAVTDPKTGLVYYYNTATRETTWERPSDYAEKKAPLSPRSATSKSKGKSKSRGKGIIGFITKRGKKSKSEAETGVAAAATSNTPKETKSQGESTEQKPGAEESQENAAAAVVESKDGWLTLDDEISRSDSEDSDSDETEATDTSIFSKTKLKDRLNLFAGKIGKKLNSPSNEPAYSTFDGGTKQEKDAVESSDGDAQEGSKEVAADNAATSTSKQLYASDTTTKAANIQPVDVESKPEWRSAVDAASGREYYYIKGSTKVTWQRPAGI